MSHFLMFRFFRSFIACIVLKYCLFIQSFQRLTNVFSWHISEPKHEKLKRSPAHPAKTPISLTIRSIRSVITVCQKKKRTNVLGSSHPLNTTKTRIRRDGFPSWSESSLDSSQFVGIKTCPVSCWASKKKPCPHPGLPLDSKRKAIKCRLIRKRPLLGRVPLTRQAFGQFI